MPSDKDKPVEIPGGVPNSDPEITPPDSSEVKPVPPEPEIIPQPGPDIQPEIKPEIIPDIPPEMPPETPV
jgi:hypothetical protein